MSNENIVKRIIDICKEKGIPVSKLEKDLGYGNGYLNPKKVSDMKAGRLFEILDYLGISVEEFFNIGTPRTQAIQTAFAQIKKNSPELYAEIMRKWLNNDEQDEEDELKAELQLLRDRQDLRALLHTSSRQKPETVRKIQELFESMEEG